MPTAKQKALAKIEEIRKGLPHQNPSTAREVIENAIAIIQRPRGWTRGSELKYETGATCALGALYVGDSAILAETDSYAKSAWFQNPAYDGLKALNEAIELVREAIPKDDLGYRSSIIMFNDTMAHDKRSVIALFRRALKKA